MTHDLRLDLPKIDDAHAIFLTLLEQLQKASFAIDSNLFLQLIEETKKHFAAEEKLMMQHLYPERELHTEDHVQLIDEMESFYQMITTMPPMVRSYIDSYAYDKFRRHTMFYDVDLAKFIKTNA